ncbi:MAG: pirin family protein, partial [Bacteroidia bacterium]|nr:pirin family protein [Bacteroidia bacterium]
AKTFSPVNLFNVRLLKDGSADFSFPGSYNTGILIIEGEVIINDSNKVSENQFVYFGHKGENIKAVAAENSILLVMGGEPLNEPVVPHGPFVMNTKEEIQKAYEDYYDGKFGYLED